MSAISARITVFKNPWSVILSASLFSAQDEQFMRRAIALAA
ncbi:tRNA adenosine(34) deaminase TadA, partial [Vibrio parahaemolyticus]|nr:tRNA adenosine(34) deaminase TadA [Vibrio parahaemolyticus]